MQKLHAHALGLSAALLAGFCMLVLGILAMNGVYMEAFAMMKSWHIWFDATVVGTIAGIVEAGVFSYVVGSLFGWLYNTISS